MYAGRWCVRCSTTTVRRKLSPYAKYPNLNTTTSIPKQDKVVITGIAAQVVKRHVFVIGFVLQEYAHIISIIEDYFTFN